MESFRDLDAATWREGHAADAISIFPTGETFWGSRRSCEAANVIPGAGRGLVRTELSGRVDGCKSAVIVYDATYDIPRFDDHQRATTVVTLRDQ